MRKLFPTRATPPDWESLPGNSPEYHPEHPLHGQACRMQERIFSAPTGARFPRRPQHHLSEPVLECFRRWLQFPFKSMGSRLLPTVDGVAAKALKDLDVDDGNEVEEKRPKNKSDSVN